MNVTGTLTLIRRELERAQRVAIQALVTPWLSAGLFILVFGKIVGARIGDINGVPYISFVLPGILMMSVLTASFMQSSSALYFQRFLKNIEEVLVAPLSWSEMVLAFIISGVLRGFLVGAGIVVIGLLFGAGSVAHPFWFLFYILIVPLLFSLAGLLVGLWAKNFEQLSIIPTFVITPLTFLGGMFNSVSMLPPAVRPFAALNPFLYMIDGLRYSMTGVSDANRTVGVVLLLSVTLVLFLLCRHLFAIGWRLRN